MDRNSDILDRIIQYTDDLDSNCMRIVIAMFRGNDDRSPPTVGQAIQATLAFQVFIAQLEQQQRDNQSNKNNNKHLSQ